MRQCQIRSMRRQSHSPRGPGVCLILSLLPLLAAFPALSSAHCEHIYNSCMTTGYINNPSFTPLKAPLTDDPIISAAKCAGYCANFGYKIYTLQPNGMCGCAATCSDGKYVDGNGYSGVTYNCFLAPSGFYATLACTSNLKKKCSKSVKCMQGATCANSGAMHKCCCSLTRPNPIFYKGNFRGCAA